MSAAESSPPVDRCDRVLIVEDSRTYATVLHDTITERFGVPVSVATTYADAKQLIHELKDEILLAALDLNLPDAPNGEIVDLAISNGLTAVVMTATFSESARWLIMSKNIADYVLKESLRDVEYIVGLVQRIRRNRHIEVLVVDDSASYRHFLHEVLAVHQYQVHLAGDGREALEVLEQHPGIRMIVTDYNMPRMDGFELISRVRRSAPREQIAIMGLSGQSRGSVSAKFLKKGANDFLTKPFSKEEFMCRVTQNIELQETIREITETSNRDALTGLYNRRYLFDVGGKYHENARREHLALTVAMLDIDHFKAVNDTYGHDAGDLVLRQVAAALEADLRGTDLVARYGGEEFCVIAVNMSDAGGRRVMKRLRRRIEELDIVHEGDRIAVTASFGVTNLLQDSLAAMIASADEMLYEAKRSGRNRVCWRTPDCEGARPREDAPGTCTT